MTEEQLQAQRRSFVLGQVGMGSDADEAAYAKAVHNGDSETLKRLDREADERKRWGEEYLDGKRGPA